MFKKKVQKKVVKAVTAQPEKVVSKTEKVVEEQPPEGYEFVEEKTDEGGEAEVMEEEVQPEPSEENLPDMPNPKAVTAQPEPEADKPQQINKNEVLDVIEGHLNRAFELLRYAKTLK